MPKLYELATVFHLFSEYADPIGLVSEDEFYKTPVHEKLEQLSFAFGDEDEGRTYLAANTVHGVYINEPSSLVVLPPEGAEILQDGDFYRALSSLPDGVTIHGIVADSWGLLIANEYGISIL